MVRLLQHGDVFSVGFIEFQAVHTPGHTPEHLSYLIRDAGSGATDLFIYPGFPFAVINGLITNFHLPQSSLLMLVAAFAGTDTVMS